MAGWKDIEGFHLFLTALSKGNGLKVMQERRVLVREVVDGSVEWNYSPRVLKKVAQRWDLEVPIRPLPDVIYIRECVV